MTMLDFESWYSETDARSFSTLGNELKFGVELVGSSRHIAQTPPMAFFGFEVEANPIIPYLKMQSIWRPE
jgi:hypothetical protein